MKTELEARPLKGDMKNPIEVDEHKDAEFWGISRDDMLLFIVPDKDNAILAIQAMTGEL